MRNVVFHTEVKKQTTDKWKMKELMRIFARLSCLGKVTPKSRQVIQLIYPFVYIYSFTQPDDGSLGPKHVGYRKKYFSQ
jgi:hypothetical protein